LRIWDSGFASGFPTLLLLAATLPLALIAPSVQMYLASFAKSFKEAQSYMGYLIFCRCCRGWLPLSIRSAIGLGWRQFRFWAVCAVH
jgi:hypothetical protein